MKKEVCQTYSFNETNDFFIDFVNLRGNIFLLICEEIIF